MTGKPNLSISIITVNYNNCNGLKKTLSSISFSSTTKFEIIIIDGRSDDGSLEVIKFFKNNNNNIFYVYEKDKGVFDAMNKGIKLSKYEWIIFMNSGDCFENCHALEDILLSNKKYDVIYGNHKMNDKIYKAQELNMLKKGIIHACHQSMIFNFKNLGNNLIYYGYKLYGDYDLIVRLYLSEFKFKYINNTISNIEPNGISQKISFRKRIEKLFIVFKYYGFKGIFNSFF